MFTRCNTKSTVTTQQINSYFPWRKSPIWAQTASMLRFLSHTLSDTYTQPPGLLRTSDHLITEAATCTTHNKHNRRKSMPSAGFGLTMSAIKQLHTYGFGLHRHRDRRNVTYLQLNIYHTKKRVQTEFATLLPPGLTLKIYSTFCLQSVRVFIPLFCSQTKDRTFPYTALTYWFANQTRWSLHHKVKAKAVPLQAWRGPQGSRRLRPPDFLTSAHEGGRLQP
jgi:hypothetical protein